MTAVRGLATDRTIRRATRLRATLLAFVALAAALFLVACDGDDGDGTPGTGTPTTGETGTPEGTATQPSGAPDATPPAYTTPAPGEGPNVGGEIGRAASDELIAQWDTDVIPGGEGLPEGSGTVAAGADVYATHCARCHGPSGTEGGIGPVLVGDPGPWEPGMPVTVGSYWPYAETVFDYTRRAMPFDNPGTLTDDEVYAVVAWILHENEIVDADAEMNRETLPQVEMPNRDNFFSCWPDTCRPDTGGAAPQDGPQDEEDEQGG